MKWLALTVAGLVGLVGGFLGGSNIGTDLRHQEHCRQLAQITAQHYELANVYMADCEPPGMSARVNAWNSASK